MGETPKSSASITIKKYANRRLYNTATSSYVTLDHLCDMVKKGQDFSVYDAKTNQDITRSVLTQIIFEEENKGQHLLPIQFLRQLIGFYGDKMGAAVPRYLEVSMESFARNQEEIRQRMAMLGTQPFKIFEDMTRQNIALFQETWIESYRRMIGLPSTRENASAPPEETKAVPSTNTAPEAVAFDEMSRLREQVNAMQKVLDGLQPSPAPQTAAPEMPAPQTGEPKTNLRETTSQDVPTTDFLTAGPTEAKDTRLPDPVAPSSGTAAKPMAVSLKITGTERS